MTDVPDDFRREFEAMYHDETLLPVHSHRFRLWCLLSAVQLASRHPVAMRTISMQIAVRMARRIQGMLDLTPALARVAEQGWDQTQDLPWKSKAAPAEEARAPEGEFNAARVLDDDEVEAALDRFQEWMD